MADGNFLTHKIGPLPGWVWIGGGAAALLLWRQHSGSSSSSSSQAQLLAQQQQLAQEQAMAASAYYPTYQQTGQPLYVLGGGGGELMPSGQPTSGSSGTPAPTTPAATPSTVGSPTQMGYGYGGDTTFTTAGGQSYVALPNVQAASDYLAKGGTEYYQPTPGVAAPWDPSLNGVHNGTPTELYQPLTTG